MIYELSRTKQRSPGPRNEADYQQSMSASRSLRMSQMHLKNEELNMSRSSIRSQSFNEREKQEFIDKLFKDRLNESRGPKSVSSCRESLNEIEEHPSEEEYSCVQNLFESQNFAQQILSQGENSSTADFSKAFEKTLRRERRLNSVISERGIKSEESSGGPKRKGSQSRRSDLSSHSQTGKRSRTLSSVKSNINQHDA